MFFYYMKGQGGVGDDGREGEKERGEGGEVESGKLIAIVFLWHEEGGD